tara:strand:+ start:317 stop:733 length:417 start_codon:yes stop_codon:yes gene_type:complete
MKRAIALAMLLAVGSPAFADYSQSGGTKQTKCYKTVYREEYVPGTRSNPGYVRRWTEKKRVPCKNRRRGHRGSHQHHHHQTNHNHGRVDDNSCIEGAVLGGIAGGGAGAALSRGDGRWWAIPLGIVGGSMVGCQIDGG